jgi:catechol 2,3-dioxygenase-like lactoylglutathione lyase family enzyme
MAVTKLHHAAYRCNDAQETADFYTKYLGLEYYAAVSEEDVPSTGEKCPYMHIFFAMKDGSCVAFFEVPESPPMQKDPNTPDWVQHLALNVESKKELLDRKKLLVDGGFDVVGPTNHGFCESIYFFDPNGHRTELTYHIGDSVLMEKLKSTAPIMLNKWNQTKKVQSDASWIHKGKTDG